MKTLKFFGSTLVLSAFLLPTFAYHSTITDQAEGLAADIVETNNVIHVYRFLGASSEAFFESTFDEGETWGEGSWLPVYKAPKTEIKSLTETSSYVQMIDDCTDAGNVWDYKTDTCR